jgi:hypothetical protein
MKITVASSDLDKEHTVAIAFRGDGIKFIANTYSILVYLNDSDADKLRFQLESLAMDKSFKEFGLPDKEKK